MASPAARSMTLLDARRGRLARRIRWLVAATISATRHQAVVALSKVPAVVGGVDRLRLQSAIEVLLATAVAWQFAGTDPEAREKTALRIIAFSFFGLAAYVAVDAVRALAGSARRGTHHRHLVSRR